ncbi:DUF6122 family protein [Croceivirga sp. JEA036]|uniref:DUF6122 family protein n=1 Tax=Croceivirga sp. JEA036 TaxID=2721162 RepID=UPI001FD7A94D|nr:DUF6122 family protein [Croceivirga sp. JEA036]
MLRFCLHYGIHFLVPVMLAATIYPHKWKKVSLILLLGIVIDLDHLLSTPVFDPNRCSINFHPLHTYWAMIVYVGLFVVKKTRIIGLALLIHILADIVDCQFIP